MKKCNKCGKTKAQNDGFKDCATCYRVGFIETKTEKTCVKCHKLKQIDSFYKLQNTCKECWKLKVTKYQKKRKTYYKFIKSKSRNKNVEFIDSLKNNPCTDCGGVFPSCAMHFDHLPGFKKEFQIGGNVSRKRSKLIAEIAKCELVCAICHSIRSYNRSYRGTLQ